jgi:S-adenosylmethionine hydrolase
MTAGDLAAIDRVEPADEYVDYRFSRLERDGEQIVGEALVVDRFGNVVTNVPGTVLAGRDRIEVDGDSVRVGDAYAAVAAGDRLVTVGSHGNVELAVNDGRGDATFGITPGDSVPLDTGTS